MSKLSIEQALLKAKSLTKKGQIAEAKMLYNTILQGFPKNKRARQGLDALLKIATPDTDKNPPQEIINQLVALYNQGALVETVAKAKIFTEQYPAAFTIWNILGAAAAQSGQIDQAVFAFQQVISLKPDKVDGYYNMGNALNDQEKFEEAISMYKKALLIYPDYDKALNNMGNSLKALGKPAEALEAYKKATSANTNNAQAYNNIGIILKDQSKFNEALAAFNQALRIKPDYAEAYNNIGIVLQDTGGRTKAIETIKGSLDLNPDYLGTLNRKSNTQKDEDILEKAAEAFKKALVLKPEYATAHRNLSAILNYDKSNPQIALVGNILKRPDIEDHERCHLHYAYAKMKEDVGEFDAAFENYCLGGALRQKLLSYNLDQDKHQFKQVYTTAEKLDNVSLRQIPKSINQIPIFILGMPRSGTTLVEQIVSSHSQVHGAGELDFLSQLASSLNRGDIPINPDGLLTIRKSYLNALNKVSNGRPYVTDKMPRNFLFIDLIRKALPEAKIIHVNRNPEATCWSNFKHYFDVNGLGYSYNLNDTVYYYKMYQVLMRVMQNKYFEIIHEFDYDTLIEDQEKETKTLIRYLGLDWQDACLSPHENKRSVITASQHQVRKKVYTGSSQAWKKYKNFIGETFNAL